MARTVKFIIIPQSVLSNQKLNPTQKLVFALLKFRQGRNACCWPGIETIASDLGIGRAAAIQAVAGLESAGLITVERRNRQSSIYRVKSIHDDEYLIITDAALSAQITPAAKLIFSYLKYRTGDNSEAWPHQKTIAADLGLSRSTASRILANLEKSHIIQTQHAHGGKKQGNRYRTTEKLFIVSKCGARLKSGASKRHCKSNTSLEVKEIKKDFSSQRGLSSSQTASDQAYWALIRERVAPKVARSIVFEQRHTPASIWAAIDNALTKAPKARKQGIAHNIPAYIVGSLNAARREAHSVNPSPVTRNERQRITTLKNNINQSTFRIISEKEKQQKLDAMKAALYADERKAI